ncbi:MAG TPA: ferritin family protein [Thermoanaerobaculia bacterium]|nr:ferritin family protein [Thermoanaerobaculia bacterium]
MKRVIFAIILLLAALPLAAAADKPIAPDVRAVMEKALANERDAVVRYTAFAAKAAEDGYRGAAALFTAMAKAENIHAQRFASALKERGIAVIPESNGYKPMVGSTADNLRSAAVAENGERDGIYRDAIDTARRNNDTEIARIFDQTRDVEVEHANLCSTASRNLDSMKQARTYYVCDKCGYTTDIALARCPDCMHGGALEPVH